MLRRKRRKSTKTRRNRARIGRHISIFEQLEDRIPLDASGFPGNDCPPDLDLSAVAAQTVEVGQTLAFNIFTAGGSVQDLDADGNPTGDEIRLQLDPDIPEDTPEGATINSTNGDFSWTPTAQQVGTFEIVVIAVDRGVPPLADSERFTVVVTPPNEAPFVDLDGNAPGTGVTTAFVEDGGPVSALSNRVFLTDADDTELESATVTLTNRLDASEETLNVSVTAPLSSSFNETTGVLTITGTDSVANYQQALRSVTYDNLSDTPDVTDRILTVTVNDGETDSEVATATITIAATNDAPLADLNGALSGEDAEQVTFTEGGDPVLILAADATVLDAEDDDINSITINITNLADGASEILGVDTTGTTITLDSSVDGRLILNGPASIADFQQVLRTLTYDNTAADAATDTRIITVTVADTDVGNPSTATVAIQPQNDPPNLVAIADRNATLGELLEVTVTATDPNGDVLTFQLDRDNTSGIPASAQIVSIDNNSARITWTPEASDGAGPFPFAVLVTDDAANALTDQESFTVTLVSNAPSVDLNGAANGSAFAATFAEGETAAAIVAPDLTVTDPDSTNVESAVARIANLQDGIDETLAVDDSLAAGISSSFDSNNGTLTLTGSDTLANYELVLRTLTYENASEDPSTVARNIEVSINDGTNDSEIVSTVVSVSAENDRPNLVLPPPFDVQETPIEVLINTQLMFTAAATDADNTDDELFFTLDLDNSGISENANQPTITSPPTAIPGGVFEWTPNELGTFEITIQTIDINGGVDAEIFVVNVVAT